MEHSITRRLEKMPDRNPVNGTFELTVRCNLHCKMCLFRHDDRENPALMRGELTAAQWIDMARQAAEAGTMQLLITGGEPMLRPDFCEIWEGIYRQGFLIGLYTNATLVNDTIMETLRKYPPHTIGVTIYGASPETYGRVCGDASAFARAIAGIHQLQTLPSKLELRMTVIRDNLADSRAVTELVQKEFGPEAFVTQDLTVMHAVRGACADVDACRLTPEEETKRKYDHVVDLMREAVGPSFDPKNIRYQQPEPPPADQGCRKAAKLTLLGCDAGMSQYTITWNGKLQGCQLLGVFSTDAAKDGLKAAWQQFPYEIKLPPRSEKCLQCEVASECQACYATRYAETGSLNGCSDYLYRDAHTRKEFKERMRRKE